jgi:acyl carrier protein
LHKKRTPPRTVYHGGNGPASARGNDRALDRAGEPGDTASRQRSAAERGVTAARPGESEIRDWCIAYLRRTLADPSVVSSEASFAAMGLDSASSVHLIVEIEEWLDLELSPELIFEQPTIAALARYLATPGRDDAGA